MVDGEFGFLFGVCISEKWFGDLLCGVVFWCDIGVVLCGFVVVEVEVVFVCSWVGIGVLLLCWFVEVLYELLG